MKDPLVKEMLEAYKAMHANEDANDQKVKTHIRTTWPHQEAKPLRIIRLGGWYLTPYKTQLRQCCVVRIHYQDAEGKPKTILREYAIPLGKGKTDNVFECANET